MQNPNKLLFSQKCCSFHDLDLSSSSKIQTGQQHNYCFRRNAVHFMTLTFKAAATVRSVCLSICCHGTVTLEALSSEMRKTTVWFTKRTHPNQAVQVQKMLLDIESIGILHYPCSENTSANQLRSYCEADLRLCFPLCRLLVFPCGGSHINWHVNLYP